MSRSLNARRVSTIAALCLLGLAVPEARADVCLVVDEAHDTFPASDRSAALMLLARHFELAGERVAPAPCPDQYTLSHIRLGDTIAVTLNGPKGRREATAIGLDDLPAVYDQMVRSILTGQPMTLRGVVDRSNVSLAQTAKPRVESDNIFYARLGYGATFADSTYGMPSIGLIGYRRELDSFGIDMSFLNFNMKMDNSYSSSDTSGGSYEWLRLEGLYFTNPKADQTMYFGGGMAFGGTSVSGGNYNNNTYRDWHGSGLSGVLTAGYELPRASTLRVFIQSDVLLPFYSLESTQYTYNPAKPYSAPTVTIAHHYAPSLAVSVGLGWGRGAHTRK